MTDIEQKALALVQEVQGFECGVSIYHVHNAKLLRQALCRAIEQHEAFRQEVSDAVERWTIEYLLGNSLRKDMAQFIIPKPVDQLAKVLKKLDLSDEKEARHYAEWVRNELDELGYEIREKAGE